MAEQLIRIFKYQALGNSYLILDPRHGTPQPLFESGRGMLRPRAEFVKALCDISKGIGSNGLLFGPISSSIPNRYRLLIINSDGTSAGFSGNGTRIFAKYLMDSKIVSPGQTIELEIPEETDHQKVTWNIASIKLPFEADDLIKVTAPHAPRFGTTAVRVVPKFFSEFPVEDGISIPRYKFPALAQIGTQIIGSPNAWSNSILVEIGNPHCVTFVPQAYHLPSFETLRAHDASLKVIAFRNQIATPIFPDGVNLQWVWPESRKRLRLMIYERGEGPTPASGSSACAAACAAFSLGLIDNDVDVVMLGGTLAVHLQGAMTVIKAVTLIGNARRILDGVVSVCSEPNNCE